MKNLFALLSLSFFLVFSTQIFAQDFTSSSDESEAFATIIKPLLLTNGDALNFGIIVPGTGGDVVVATDGTRSSSASGLGLVTTNNNTVSAASFTVTGEESAAYNISLPANGTVTLASGSNTLPVKDFVSSVGSGSTLDGSGNDSFNVGATLEVANNQAAGNYTGQFEVTVDYN